MGKHLLIAFLASMTLHALILGTMSLLSKKQVYAKNPGQGAMKVKLSVYQPPVKSPPKTAGKKKKQAKAKKHQNTSSLSKVKQNKGSDQLIAKFLTAVRSAILNNKYKSRMAKKMRLKGEVELFFVLKSPNIIQDLKVIKPSPYGQLNESAMQTVASVSDVPVIPPKLNLQEIPITVVISYQ